MPISSLHLPWPPMVSTLAYSETLCLNQDSTSQELLWSPLLKSQSACAHLSTPPPMGSNVSTLASSESTHLLQDSTYHGLVWSPLLRSQLDHTHLLYPPPIASYGLHLGKLRNYSPFLWLNFIILFIFFLNFFFFSVTCTMLLWRNKNW